jgi:hypothetical protein
MKAVFLWKDNNSPETIDTMLPLCQEKARQLGWDGELKLFTEGFGGGTSFDNLIALSGSLTGVILHNVGKWHGNGSKLLKDLQPLKQRNIPISLALIDYDTVSTDVLRIVADSDTYYSRLRSQSIRVGMKKRSGGRPPYGMSYNEEGHLVENEDWEKVVIVFNLHRSNMPIAEISRMTGLTGRKVRQVLDTHAKRFNSA